MAIALGSFAVGAFIGMMTREKNPSPDGGVYGRIGLWLRKYPKGTPIVWALLMALMYFSKQPDRWFGIGFLLTPVCAWKLNQQGVLRSLIPNLEARTTVVYILFFVMVVSYGEGQRKAEALRSGASFQFVIPSDEVSLAGPTKSPLTYPRFVEHAGEVVFLWHPASEVVSISKFDAKQPLNLLSCPESKGCAAAYAQAASVPTPGSARHASSVPTAEAPSAAVPDPKPQPASAPATAAK